MLHGLEKSAELVLKALGEGEPGLKTLHRESK
jgi:hypothetical protein